MTSVADRFPGITRAALEIAYSNGGITCVRTQQRMLGELSRWLDRQPAETLPDIDAWLFALSDEDLQMVCDGEQSEADAVLQFAPPFTDRLLADYFDEVC